MALRRLGDAKLPRVGDVVLAYEDSLRREGARGLSRKLPAIVEEIDRANKRIRVVIFHWNWVKREGSPGRWVKATRSQYISLEPGPYSWQPTLGKVSRAALETPP